MSGDSDFGRDEEMQFLSKMGQQWPSLLYFAGTLSNLQSVPTKAVIPSARAVSTAPYLLGWKHPCIGQCSCLQFPVSLWLNLHWPLSRQHAFRRASDTVWRKRNDFLQDCGSMCTDSSWWGISAASLNCSQDLWNFPSFVSEPSSTTSTRR